MMELSKHNVDWLIYSRDLLGTLLIRPTVKRTKVCIVGFEEGVHQQAPMNDPEWEIWGLNHANLLGFMRDSEGKFRCDRWFDLHQEHAQSETDLAWTHSCPVPIYLTSLYTQNPMASVYPLERVVQTFQWPFGTRQIYFCSSFAYMLMLAAMEGFKEIRISGVNLNFGRELPIERVNLEYWIGYLRGRGYNITIPEVSKLCRHPYLYGFEYTEEKEWVEERMANLIYELLSYPEIVERFKRKMEEQAKAVVA